MALADLPRVTKELTNKELSNILAMVLKELEFVINGRLDVKNIKADGIEARNIKAGSVTADKIEVDELSAISANLGKIISGEIYGTYIATNEGTYPRAEMNDTGDYFRALAASSIYTELTTSFGGAPALHCFDGVTSGVIQTFSIFGSTFVIGSTADIDLRPGTGNKVNIPSWSQIYSNGDGQTLADALNNLATAIAGKATKGVSTGSAGSASLNGGIPIGTQLATAGGGSVTWGGINISAHTHNQV